MSNLQEAFLNNGLDILEEDWVKLVDHKKIIKMSFDVSGLARWTPVGLNPVTGSVLFEHMTEIIGSFLVKNWDWSGTGQGREM